MMLRAAYDVTKEIKFLVLQRKAFDWFLGANDLRVALYDFRTKGCSDGLMPGGINGNQGAESTLSFMLSLLAVIESYAIVDKIQGEKAPPDGVGGAYEVTGEDRAGTDGMAGEEGVTPDQVSEAM